MNVRLKFKKSTARKVVKDKSTNKAVSRLCLAKVKQVDGIWRAAIDVTLEYGDATMIEIDIKPETLVNKQYLFSKHKDETGRHTTIIRDKTWTHHGFNDEQYDVLRDGLIIAGHIYMQEGKYIFGYEEFVGYDYGRFINDVVIRTGTPVFHKGYGNNKQVS